MTTDIVDSSVSETCVEMADVLEEKYGPSRSIVEGRLNNSEELAILAYHLCEPEKTDIIKLVSLFPSLFSDVPTQTHVIEHDIDAGMAQPVKQHPYRENPVKRKLLQIEVDYLLII